VISPSRTCGRTPSVRAQSYALPTPAASLSSAGLSRCNLRSCAPEDKPSQAVTGCPARDVLNNGHCPSHLGLLRACFLAPFCVSAAAKRTHEFEASSRIDFAKITIRADAARVSSVPIFLPRHGGRTTKHQMPAPPAVCYVLFVSNQCRRARNRVEWQLATPPVSHARGGCPPSRRRNVWKHRTPVPTRASLPRVQDHHRVRSI
jgi:hypothetical protein